MKPKLEQCGACGAFQSDPREYTQEEQDNAEFAREVLRQEEWLGDSKSTDPMGVRSDNIRTIAKKRGIELDQPINSIFKE